MDKRIKEEIVKRFDDVSREDLCLMLIAADNRDKEISPRAISIDAEEMKRIEEVLRVFSSYIERHYYFEILVSKKFGIIAMDIDGGIKYFEDADSLFYWLVEEINGDVRDLKIAGTHETTAMNKQEEEEVVRRVLPLLDQLQDREHYNEIFQDFLDEYREAEE